MTFEEYINNPMGLKNAVFSNRNLYRDLYTDKFNKLMVRENSKIDYAILKSKSAYYILLKIPSEAVEEVYYDVCIKFDIKSVVPKLSIKDCPVKFYSNDPYFCYTFAYAFNKRKIFVEELSSKIDKEFLKDRAKERNPSNEVGYDKALYFAFLAMQLKGLFSLAKLESECKPYSEKLLLSLVTHSKDKIQERQERGYLKNKSAKKEKRNTIDNRTYNGTNTGNIRKTGTVNSVRSSSSVKSIRKSKIIGKR